MGSFQNDIMNVFKVGPFLSGRSFLNAQLNVLDKLDFVKDEDFA